MLHLSVAEPMVYSGITL